MPLRALLLPSEQPSFTPSATTTTAPLKVNKTTKGKHVPSPLNLSPSSRLNAVLGALSPALVTASGSGQSAKPVKADNDNGSGEELVVPDFEDIENVLTGRTDLGWPFDLPEKPLPSPPLPKEESEPPLTSSNRSSNQTYQTSLTLPSTSGSSRSGSTECPSPPLSPSAITLTQTTSPLALSSSLPVSPLSLTKKPTGNKSAILVPSIKRDAKGRPLLKLATTFPRVGAGLKYRIPPAPSTSRPYSHGVLEGDMVVDSPYEDEDDEGRRTAREAVDERLRHLVETRKTLQLPPGGGGDERPNSPSRVTFTSPISSRPGSRLLEGLNRISRLSTLSIPLPVVTSKETSTPPLALSKNRKSTTRRSRKPTTTTTKALPPAVNPPSAPTVGLPPYKILSDEELLELLGDSYLDSFGDGRSVMFKECWRRRDISRMRRVTVPRGTKGRYIRLCTLPDLPELPPVLLSNVEDEVSTGGKRRGRQPTVLVEDSAEREEGREEKKEIPTVYLPNTLKEYQEPIACFACPPLSLPSTTPALSSPGKSPALSLYLASTTIHHLPDRTHLLPLPHLSSAQRTALQTLGLLVYGVPRGYEGPVPPVLILDEEVVGPWASGGGSRMGAGLLAGNRSSTSSIGSPLKGSFPPTSPLRLGFSRDGNAAKSTTASGASSLGVDVGSPGSGLGGGSRWGWKRSSNLSVRSAESTISEEAAEHDDDDKAGLNISRPTSPDPDAVSSAGIGGKWGSSFTSLRARAQDYYASSRAASPSPSALEASPSLSTRLLVVDPESVSIGDTPESVMPLALGKKHSPLATETTPSTPPTIGTSRSFGSFFSRNNSAQSTVTPSLSSGVTSSFSMSALMSRSSSNTSSSVPTPSEEEEALKELREAGIVVKCLDDQGAEEEVVFDFNTLKSNSSVAAVVEEAVVSTGNTGGGGEKKAGWGWRGRWGS